MRIAVKILFATAIACILAFSNSCRKIESEPVVKGQVLLYYAAGFNDLSSYLEKDIEELCNGYVPDRNSRNVLLIFQNLAKENYSEAVSPELFRVYRDSNGRVIKETVFSFSPGTVAASASTLFATLSYIRYNYPSESYGMIFSSHATGWLPASNTTSRALSETHTSPSSIGNEYSPETGTSVQYEMDLADFADAIPMHLDYILFDACFMGGIEVAYQLKDVCDRIVFSSAEVIADGFDYRTMTSYLLKSAPDLYGECKSYYEHYMSLSGQYKSATVSLVDCSRLDNLASVCKEIFTRHREELDMLNPSDIQCFGRINKHMYFYDMKDIMDHMELSSDEKEAFDTALDDCILYAATTGQMINIKIDRFCGMSSYCTNKYTYDDFYRTLAWNKATGMIQ